LLRLITFVRSVVYDVAFTFVVVCSVYVYSVVVGCLITFTAFTLRLDLYDCRYVYGCYDVAVYVTLRVVGVTFVYGYV